MLEVATGVDWNHPVERVGELHAERQPVLDAHEGEQREFLRGPVELSCIRVGAGHPGGPRGRMRGRPAPQPTCFSARVSGDRSGDVACSVRQDLEVGEFAVDVAEHDRRDSDVEDELRSEHPGLEVPDALEQEPGQHDRHDTVDHVSEDEPEEERVGEQHEQRRVDLSVGRPSHKVGEQFQRLARMSVDELDRWKLLFRPVVGVTPASGCYLERLDVDVDAGARQRLANLIAAGGLDPTVEHERVSADSDSYRSERQRHVPFEQLDAGEEGATVLSGPAIELPLQFPLLDGQSSAACCQVSEPGGDLTLALGNSEWHEASVLEARLDCWRRVVLAEGGHDGRLRAGGEHDATSGSRFDGLGSLRGADEHGQ